MSDNEEQKKKVDELSWVRGIYVSLNVHLFLLIYSRIHQKKISLSLLLCGD